MGQSEAMTIIQVHIIPSSSKDEVVGLYDGRLKIKITSAPVDGKANAHLIAFLAKEFGVPKNRVELLKGETSKKKTLAIAAPKKRPDWLNYLEEQK